MSVPVAGRSWVSPGPYTFVLAGTGLMGGTVDRQTTSYQSFKPDDQGQVAPTSFGYSADNPAFGATTDYNAFPLGMGLRSQRHQNVAEDGRYAYALGVDASVYPWVKGPDLTTFTPTTTDATNGVTRFMKVGSNYYAITGRYALLRVNDTSWTVAQDFGAAKVSLDALAFYSNGVGAAYGFVAMGDSDNFWYVTGGVWAQHASLKARAFGLTGREFYRAHTTNTLAKVDTDADPATAANWSNDNAFTIGDQSSGITRLVTTRDGTLLAIKTDGVYTLDEVGDDHLLHPFVPDSYNGRAVGLWGNHTYAGFTYNGFYRFDESGTSREQVGPELLVDGSNVVAGQVTACCGTAYALYGAIYNPDTGNSYLAKFLGVAEVDGKKHPVWHGSLSQALTAKVTAMDVQTDGAAAGHVRLYLGYANGKIGWFTLPCTPHPADCSSYRFTTTDGTIDLPDWDQGFGANVKALDAVTMKARNFSSTNYAVVSYRTDPTGAFTAMSEHFDSGQREKVEFPSASSATVLGLRVTLTNSVNTSSLQITGLGLLAQVQTDLREVYEIFVLAEDGLRRRDGAPLRIGRDRIKDVVTTAASTPGSVTLVLPEGDSVQVRVKGFRKTTAWDWSIRRPRSSFALECVQVTTNVVYGTHARMEAQGSHAALMARTHAQLMAL